MKLHIDLDPEVYALRGRVAELEDENGQLKQQLAYINDRSMRYAVTEPPSEVKIHEYDKTLHLAVEACAEREAFGWHLIGSWKSISTGAFGYRYLISDVELVNELDKKRILMLLLQRIAQRLA
jgi:hypothetical protein